MELSLVIKAIGLKSRAQGDNQTGAISLHKRLNLLLVNNKKMHQFFSCLFFTPCRSGFNRE